LLFLANSFNSLMIISGERMLDVVGSFAIELANAGVLTHRLGPAARLDSFSDEASPVASGNGSLMVSLLSASSFIKGWIDA
jgi:hypothetical protein